MDPGLSNSGYKRFVDPPRAKENSTAPVSEVWIPSIVLTLTKALNLQNEPIGRGHAFKILVSRANIFHAPCHPSNIYMFFLISNDFFAEMGLIQFAMSWLIFNTYWCMQHNITHSIAYWQNCTRTISISILSHFDHQVNAYPYSLKRFSW